MNAGKPSASFQITVAVALGRQFVALAGDLGGGLLAFEVEPEILEALTFDLPDPFAGVINDDALRNFAALRVR